MHSDYRSLPEYEAQFVRPYAGTIDGTTAQLMAFRKGRVRLDTADVQHLIDLYDAGIRQMDDELARLLDGFSDDPGLLVLVVGDHGDEFLEHGGVLHGRTQYQELVRVPLILRGAGVPRGVRVATTASLVDVLPTILSAVWRASAGGPRRGGPRADVAWRRRRARHALSLERGRPQQCGAGHGPGGAASPAHAAFRSPGAAGSRSSISPSTRTSRPTSPAARPDVVADLRVWLERFRAAHAASGDAVTLTPEQLERLRSLGYIR